MEIHKIIDLSNWKKIDTILVELHLKTLTLDRRNLRNYIAKHNKRFCEHKTDIYIAHGPKGYKATKSVDEINASINDLYVRSIDMLKKYYSTKKAMRENCNAKLDLEKEGII